MVKRAKQLPALLKTVISFGSALYVAQTNKLQLPFHDVPVSFNDVKSQNQQWFVDLSLGPEVEKEKANRHELPFDKLMK